MYRILPILTAALVASALTSCFSLGNPFKRPEPEPVVSEPKEVAPEPKPKPPAKPKDPVPQANAFYEVGSASASFFVSRPKTDRVDRVPDDILSRGTVVQVLVPQSGGGWTRVRLEDAQTGFIPLADLNVVPASQRPSGFSSSPSRIDTGPLDLPEVPIPIESPKRDPLDDINLDLPGTEPAPSSPTTPAPPSSPSLPEAPDAIKIDDDLPEI